MNHMACTIGLEDNAAMALIQFIFFVQSPLRPATLTSIACVPAVHVLSYSLRIYRDACTSSVHFYTALEPQL